MPKWIGTTSEFLGWVFLAGILIAGAPLFICMPLWADVTYYDVCARNILGGGVHYRDVFETNLPGMVWLHAVIRPIVGWSSEAFRAVDLMVVGSSILLLGLLLKRIGVPRRVIVWSTAASFFFYLYQTEYSHCQRDGWMLLPTIVAVWLRGRQLARDETASKGCLFRSAIMEGMAWACAIWIKPHCLIPALFVWLAGVRRLAGMSWRRALIDFAGLLAGGLLVGGAGSAWLIATGTWPWMWDVLLNWNPEYYRWTPQEMNVRLSALLNYFAPWSEVHLLAIPVALIALCCGRVWRFGPTPGMKPARLDQALLAALYLGWLTEATLFQKVFDYSQAPVVLLAMAVLTAHRVPIGQLLVIWCLAGATLNYLQPSVDSLRWMQSFADKNPTTFRQLIPEHRLINHRFDWCPTWWKCVSQGSSPQTKDRLTLYSGAHSSPTWTELDAMRRYLQTLDLKDGELVCLDDSTHPLYLDLRLRPGFRFIHVNTSMDFRSKRPRIMEELKASGHKYVVSDTAIMRFLYEDFAPVNDSSFDQSGVPIDVPCVCRDIYPWNQPVIHREGRYWLHRVENPIQEIRIPYPRWADRP